MTIEMSQKKRKKEKKYFSYPVSTQAGTYVSAIENGNGNVILQIKAYHKVSYYILTSILHLYNRIWHNQRIYVKINGELNEYPNWRILDNFDLILSVMMSDSKTSKMTRQHPKIHLENWETTWIVKCAPLQVPPKICMNKLSMQCVTLSHLPYCSWVQ